MTRPAVAVVNACPGLDQAEVVAAVEAIQIQVDRDFEPAHGIGATLAAFKDGDAIPPDAWPVRLVPTCDDPGALGYHDDPQVPSGIVGVQTAKDDGVPWTSVLSHEVLELLADPWADVARQSGASFYAMEVCDPVEGQPYSINGVAVERFILPSWFRDGSPGPWDFAPPGDKALLAAPLSLISGGYCSVFAGGAWSQTNAERVRASRREPHPLSRRGRRFARSVVNRARHL